MKETRFLILDRIEYRQPRVKAIRLTDRAQEQAIERGKSEAEIIDTLITGNHRLKLVGTNIQISSDFSV